MAQKRMFSLKIVDTDEFLDMPLSTQSLYFHLGMRADDEGFVGNTNRIMRMIGSSADDLKILLAKRFIIEFDSGVHVIKHWKINNYIQNDRTQATTYLEEKAQLHLKENKSYTECIQNVSIDKYSIDKISIVEGSEEENKSTKTRHLDYVLLKDDEFDKLIDKYGNDIFDEYSDRLNNYIGSKGKKYKSHYHTLLTWIKKDNVPTLEELNKPKVNDPMEWYKDIDLK